MKVTPVEALSQKISTLTGVGKVLAARLRRLGIETVQDLIFYFPFRYEDFQALAKAREIQPGAIVSMRGKIELIGNKRTFRQRKIITEALLADETGVVKVVWFNQPWIGNSLVPGDEIVVSGKVAGGEFDPFFSSPNYEKVERAGTNTAAIIPVYPLTEGINQKQLRALIRRSLGAVKQLGDYLPADIIKNEKLVSLDEAIRQIHFPIGQVNLAAARRRLAFEEIFLLQLKSLLLKQSRLQLAAQPIKFFEAETKKFVTALPFKLTGDQKKSAWAILQDMQAKTPMSRLLEGDVGAGKTVVAAIAFLNIALNKKQAAFLAPTSILAFQHFNSLLNLLKTTNCHVGLITAEHHLVDNEELTKKEFLRRCAAGEIEVVVGTHALIQKDVVFKNLALLTIDEQHRFGVNQRQYLLNNKKKQPHLLSLSATPIPRSLALTIYGDLDLSLIREKPAQRKAIITKIVPADKRIAAYQFIDKQLSLGRQVFVVCPLIDSSDKLGVKSVAEEFERLNQEIFPEVTVDILHGRLKPSVKDKILTDFLENKIKILVATSVVEVGIDIPNATVMLIEGAERFGLAQLHQLRGRVGRSEYQSYCFAFSDTGDQKTIKRLQAFADCSDGFVLAEKDLQLRGAGDVYGLEQSGFNLGWRLADFSDLALIVKIKKIAKEFLTTSDLADYPELVKKLPDLAGIKVLE